MKKIIAIVMMMLAVVMVGCNKGDKIEKAFSEYAKTENIPDYNGVESIELVDSVVSNDAVSKIEFQADSVSKLLDKKIKDLTAYYGGLSYSDKQQYATEYARIGAEYGEICVNNTGNDEAIIALKDAVENLSPYKQPLYIHHIKAKIGSQSISFYSFSVGDEVSIIKAEDINDAMRKNDKFVKWRDAIEAVVRTKFVPQSMLIDDIDKFISNGK